MRTKANIGRVTASLISVSAVAICSAGMLAVRQYLNPTEVALALLLIVLVAATLFGSRPALAASVAAIISFNFLFLPPYYTFNISGPENWVAFTAFLITATVAGQLSGYARRRAEESEAKQQEIERLYAELQNAFEQASEAEALRKSEKLKSSLLDAVTHDLRTPLTSIKASVTTLLEEPESADLDKESRSELLAIIDEETDRLNEFIESMVGLAKIESNSAGMRKSSHSIDEIVANAVGRASKRIQDHVLKVAVEPGLPMLYVDAASIAEVIFTLLDNAAKYSPRGSVIMVDARMAAGDLIEVSVLDQGKGIPVELRKKVFDKFVRGESSDIHTTGSGLGLGLAIARGLVESQGGDIRIDEGSTGFTTAVVFTLPLKRTEDG